MKRLERNIIIKRLCPLPQHRFEIIIQPVNDSHKITLTRFFGIVREISHRIRPPDGRRHITKVFVSRRVCGQLRNKRILRIIACRFVTRRVPSPVLHGRFHGFFAEIGQRSFSAKRFNVFLFFSDHSFFIRRRAKYFRFSHSHA